MEVMMEDLFNNNRSDTRITVFKDANIFRQSFIYCLLLLKQTKNWLIKSSKFEWPPRGKFLYVKERLGTEFTKSKTFLYYSPHTRKECQGIAGVVRQSLEEITVTGLPDIEGIDLEQVNLKGRSANSKAVREYMKRGYIRDISTLKRLNRKAQHFYGSILTNDQGQPKGVLVIDSVQPNCPFSDEAAMHRLSQYLKLFTPTM